LAIWQLGNSAIRHFQVAKLPDCLIAMEV